METSPENTTDEKFCVICNLTGAEVQGFEKGLSTLTKVSVQRNDGLQEKIKSYSTAETHVHEQCRKRYTAKKDIAKSTKSTTSSENRILRTLSSNFNYDTHCLICAKEIDFENVKKHPNPSETVSNIEYVKEFGKYGKVQETLLEICECRRDEESTNIKARIAAAGDIRAPDSKYHRSCLQRFLSGRGTSLTSQNRRNEDSVNYDAFLSLTEWLTSQFDKQFTLSDLQQRLRTYLPEDVEPYSIKHLKRRLTNHFGEKITFTEIDGKTNVLTFSDKAKSILQSSYFEEETEFQEEVKQANMLGKHVRKKLEDLIESDNANYPSPQDIDLARLESMVPDVLLAFVNGLMRRTSSENAKEKQRLEVVSLCHALMQASAPQSFISPLILSTGLFIHQTRSKVLLNALSKLGFSASYDQVMEFEKAAVLTESIEDLHPGIEPHSSGGGFCQWVADNFDYNEDTLTGYNTTHAMGIIACQTPASKHKIMVPRQRTTKPAADIESSGDFGSIIKPYRPTGSNLLSKKKFEMLPSIEIGSLKDFLKLDTLWMLSNSRFQVTPSWQGFMSEISQGECLSSSILYHPILPLNPQTDEAVHSTMVFMDKQRRRSRQCCAMLTFDQAIYAKGYKIKAENPNEFQHLQLRLGGFHQLMSFLGSGCKAMEGSGLEEVWSTVYAKNTLGKMFEGKSYTKTLRACLLTSAALHTLVMTHGETDQHEDGELETAARNLKN